MTRTELIKAEGWRLVVILVFVLLVPLTDSETFRYFIYTMSLLAAACFILFMCISDKERGKMFGGSE